MAWSIIFYFCRLFVIFLFSFFFWFIFIIYLFITATYCQFISIYYLINHYLLSCSLIALKIYLVHTIISIFYYCWCYYVSPQFFFVFFLFYIRKELPNFSNRFHILWYSVSVWLFCIFFFKSDTLRPSLGCWSLCYFFIWHHSIMVSRG